MNIGIFDSGLGGLTIFKGLLKELPEYNYLYLGDNARVPYGSRSSEVIYEFTCEAVEYLFQHNCQIIIIACNTASSAALRRIQNEYLPSHYPDRRVLGVIRPTAEIIAESDFRKIGIIGTRATIRSESFVKEIHKLSPEREVFQNAGPLLVPFIEEGEIENDAFTSVLTTYLKPFKEQKIQALVLACTHYGLVADKIREIVGNTTEVIAEGSIIPQKLKDYFLRHPEIENKLTKNKERIYCVTDINNRYKHLVEVFLDGYFTKSDMLQLVHI